MKRILLTGMSGTGKSAIVAELVRRGQRAVDLDTPEWSHWVAAEAGDTLTPRDGEDWVWREDRVRKLLSSTDERPLFVSGCAENMDRLLDLIDVVILLSAPIGTVMDRLAARTSGAGYGGTAAERERIGELVATVEPQLRQIADIEIDTAKQLTATVEEVLRRTT